VSCAAACDVAGSGCAAHMIDAMGQCTLLSSYDVASAAPDSLKYALCFKGAREWDAFGRPNKGMYW
jgi:hypothetical protein